MKEIIIDFTKPQTTETIDEMKQDVVQQLANFIQSNAADIDDYSRMETELYNELDDNLIVKRVQKISMDDLSEDITIKEMKEIIKNNDELLAFQNSWNNTINTYELVEAAESLAIKNYLKEQDSRLTDEAIDLIVSFVRNEISPDSVNFALSVSETWELVVKVHNLIK